MRINNLKTYMRRKYSPDFHHPTKDCFLCGEKLGNDVVYWNGTEAEIWLHPTCAVELSAQLMNDANRKKVWHDAVSR